MLYDGHTHLNDIKVYDNWEKLLQNFIDLGGKGLVNQGVNEDRNQRAVQIAQKCQNMDIYVKATIGFHPEEVIAGSIKDIDIKNKLINLKKQYEGNKDFIPAIGECGMDFHYEDSLQTKNTQKNLLGQICDLSQELNLPLVIHSRDAFADTIDVLQNYKNLKYYFHCRGYGPDELQKILNIFPNTFIGFAGNVTYPKAIELKNSLLKCPMERIILETDAPYLAPQKFRGQTNEPAMVKYIYDFASQILATDDEYLQNIVEQNFKNFYNIN